MAGLYGTEVSAVERRNLGHSEPFCDRDDACISPAKWEVGILLNELGHAFVVSGGDVDRDQSPAGNNRKNAASLWLPARVSSM